MVWAVLSFLPYRQVTKRTLGSINCMATNHHHPELFKELGVNQNSINEFGFPITVLAYVE
jgi:hypothetical protein